MKRRSKLVDFFSYVDISLEITNANVCLNECRYYMYIKDDFHMNMGQYVASKYN